MAGLLFLVVARLHAEEPLTNADVVRMLKAGLGPDTIIAKIESAPTAFATDTASLVALAMSGVPDAVIRAMVRAHPAPAPPPATAVARLPEVLAAWTPTSAQPIPRGKYFELPIMVLQEYPETGTISACEGGLRIDDGWLTTSPSTRCEPAPGFTLPWSSITSFCYRYEETIPTMQLGRRWHGTLRITARGKEYLAGIYTREHFDAVRTFLHAYRGNIPESCAAGPGASITPAQTGFPLVHPALQHRPDKTHTCQGALTLDSTGLRFDTVAGSCATPLVVPWERITRVCYEEPVWTSRQITFSGTDGAEWNFFSHGRDGDRALRDLHDQLKIAKPDLIDRCD